MCGWSERGQLCVAGVRGGSCVWLEGEGAAVCVAGGRGGSCVLPSALTSLQLLDFRSFCCCYL